MTRSRARRLLVLLMFAAALRPPAAAQAFTPDWTSLEQYRCPEWFRDAKRFGVSTHMDRFTTKGAALYAIGLDRPKTGSTVVVRSLGERGPAGKIADVSLLGAPGKLDWTQTADGLTVRLPDRAPCDFAFALKIRKAG